MSYYIKNNQVVDHAQAADADDKAINGITNRYSGETLYTIDTPEIQAILNPPPTVEQLSSQAVVTRDSAIEADIEYSGVMFQADEKAELNINRVLGEVYRNAELEGETRMWRASDNSWQSVTPEDLRNIISMKVQRMDEIFTEFAAWDASDKSDAFNPSL